MMPGIDGIATLEELKKIDEDLPSRSRTTK
jgi:hypothetical protein